MIEIHPADAWARRELALVLADQHRFDEGFAALAEAEPLEPVCTSFHLVRARLLTMCGRNEDAKCEFREALRISIDLDQAIHGWIDACETEEERRDTLGFIQDELVVQVTFGPGLLTFRDAAQGTLQADELLVTLQTFLDGRPDLWQAWATVVRQLKDMDQLDEALEVAQEALQRFPLLQELWVELAEVYLARKDDDNAVKALQKALQIAPGWSEPWRKLSELHLRRGQADEAKLLIGRAIARAPRNAENHFMLASVLWNNGERRAALERMQHAVELDPGHEKAWDYLCDWAAELGRYQLVVDLAGGLTKTRPGEVRSWMRLTQALMRVPEHYDCAGPDRLDQSLQALARIHELAPRQVESYDLEAQVLLSAGKADEAEAACQAPVWAGKPPLILRGRQAWVIAQRSDLPRAIHEMRAILKEDPAYYWGWTRLAEWYDASGNQQNFLSAAQQLVRLAPHTPEPWALRGEAKLRLGDRKGAKKDLRHARDMAPDYARPGLALFDEHLADGELGQARNALRILYRTVRDDFVKTRVVQWFALRRKSKQAARAFLQICRSANPTAWPLETAAHAMREAGWQSRVQHVFQKVLGEEKWNPNVALLWAESFDPDVDADLEKRLEALNRAQPRLSDAFRPLDLKAELLAKAKRFDQALAVCKDPPESAAIPLRGRAAWIEWQRGSRASAVSRMQEVVADDPSYYWGWSCLADWCVELERREDHLEAAEKLVQLAADNPVAYVHRAQARRQLDNTEGATEDYRRAFDLAPDYMFAALQLFDLYLEAEETHAAEELLEHIQKYASAAELALATIRLANAKGEPRSALNCLEQLCKAGENEEGLLEPGIQVLEQAGLASEVEAMLVKSLGAGKVVAQQWVALAARSDWLAAARERIEQLPNKHPGKRHAVEAYAGLLAKESKIGQLHAWVDKQREDLSKDTMTWGMIGHYFSLVLDDQATADWLGDWHERDDVHPWMLLNLVLALRGLGRFGEARRVSQFVVSKLVPDFTSRYHELWLILDDGLDGKEQVLQAYFDRHEVDEFDPNHQWVAALASALLATLKKRNKTAAFAAARRLLVEAAASIQPIDRDLVFEVAYKKTVRGIADNCGGARAKLWQWWRCRRPLMCRRKAAGEY
jgi:tetratricopeptide (TPR) repeat protein